MKAVVVLAPRPEILKLSFRGLVLATWEEEEEASKLQTLFQLVQNTKKHDETTWGCVVVWWQRFNITKLVSDSSNTANHEENRGLR